MASQPSTSTKRRKRVLAIDDEPQMTEWLKMVIEAEGYEVRTALIGTRGEEIYKQWRPDVVVTDLMLPDLDGVQLLRRLKEIDHAPEVIVISGQGTIARAVEAGQAGAFYFLEKPVSQDGLMDIIGRAIDRTQERAEHQQLKDQIRGQYSFANIVGQSKKMKELFELVESVAASDANIDKVGLFEMAEGGSLLLDEIGEMPPYLQTKLLRVLQEREYRPIGSDRIVHVDFRLICATNIDIEAALRDGRLREDLYFRINTITLRVPPLRERTEDIPLLCDYFLEKCRQRYQENVKTLAPSVYHLLIRNRWPGNVRELENAIERAVLVAKGTEIAVADLPESIREESTSATDFVIPPHRTLAEIEKMAILQTLQRTNWNKQEAAQILGLYRPTLYSKMKKHEIQDGGKSGARRAAGG